MMDYAAVRGHLSSRDIAIPVDEWRTWETCDIFAPFPPPTNTADTAVDTAAEAAHATIALDRLRPRPREDVLTRLRESDDLADAALIEACASYPEWVDWDQVARATGTLFYVSLVGGF